MTFIPSAQFEAWRHRDIDGEVIDTENLPFSDDFFSDSFPATVMRGDVDSLPLDQTGKMHKRSYEIAVGKYDGSEFQASAYWGDTYGNRYTVLTTKGNNFTHQSIFSSATAPSGYIPYGLMEGDALVRILRASKMMREDGIDTEWIVRVLEPKELMFENEKVDQATFKKKLLGKVIVNSLKDEENGDEEEVARIAAAIKDMSFYVILRAMSTPIRPGDFLNDKDALSVQSKMKRIFNTINTMFDDDDLDVDTKDRVNCDYTAPEHISHYWTTALPRLLATSLASLHNLGLAHRFPVAGNVNAFGGLVDLDSVHGEPLGLGDSAITPLDIGRDIDLLLSDEAYEGLDRVIYHLERLGVLDEKDNNVMAFQGNFIEEYLQVRDYDVSSKQGAMQLLGQLDVLKSVVIDEYARDKIKEAVTTLTGGLKLEEIIDPKQMNLAINISLRSNVDLYVSTEVAAFCMRHLGSVKDIAKHLQGRIQPLIDVTLFSRLGDEVKRIVSDIVPQELSKRLHLSKDEADAAAIAYRLIAMDETLHMCDLEDSDLQEMYWNAIERYIDSLPEPAIGSSLRRK